MAEQGTVVAAVGFDEQTEIVIGTALSLARLSRADVILVHALEPPHYDAMVLETPGYSMLPALLQANEEARLKDRQKMMNELLAKLGDGTKHGVGKIEGRVRRGDVLRMLVTESVAAHGRVIVVACHPDAYRFLPQGLSTALSLMHDAPLPVLVVGRKPLNFEQPGLRILVADDLQEGTREAVRKAYELATRISRPKIHQVHVHGDIRELLRDTWIDAIQKIPGLRALDRTPESLWSDEYDARLDAMKKQAGPNLVAAAEHGAQVELDVRTGDLLAEIEAVAADFDPDLIVYGRHRLWRAKPFLIGRMPLKAMVHDGRSVLLVPPARELYARLPFP